MLKRAHRLASIAARYAVKRVRYSLPLGRRPVVTYGTFRTASTSIHHSIRSQLGGCSIKAHMLAPDHLADPMRDFSTHELAGDGIPKCSHYGNFAVRHGIILPGRPADFVITVRDPVAVASSLFYSFSGWWTPRLRRAASSGAGDRELHAAVEECFFGRFPRSLMLDWLSLDVPGGIGWDFFASPFDSERGFQEYTHGALRILVIRSDLPNADREVVLRRFLGAPGLQLRSINSGLAYGGERPAIAAATKAVLRGRRDWLESVSADPRLAHLWGEPGVRRLLDRWLAPG